MDIKIGVSARHVHLSKEDIELLFGKNYKLTKIKNLSQYPNYVCKETVDLINGDNIIKNVRIVGPKRDKSQVEISKTDAYTLKIEASYKDSGDLNDASLITINGPIGNIKRKALIFPNRHIHMNTKDAKYLGLNNNDIVKIKIDGEKGGILDNVHIKISKDYNTELHLDLDDANSHNVINGDISHLIK